MNDDNIQDYSDEDDVTAEFSEVYTSLIHSKMVWNNIGFEGVVLSDEIRLPRCVIRGSLRRLIKDVKAVIEEVAGDAWDWENLDLSVEEQELDLSPAAREKREREIETVEIRRISKRKRNVVCKDLGMLDGSAIRKKTCVPSKKQANSTEEIDEV